MSMIILIIFLPSIVDGFFFDIERVYIPIYITQRLDIANK